MYQIVVFIHLLSAIVWVGGQAFLALVAVPATRTLPAAERGAILQAVGQQFRPVGWACIGLLLISGLLISGYRGMTWAALVDGSISASPFGRLLAIKGGLVTAMVALTLAHDLWLGPASARALTRSGAAAETARRRLRRASSWTARLGLLLALVVVFLAVALVRGLP